jgi:hypothetical protein
MVCSCVQFVHKCLIPSWVMRLQKERFAFWREGNFLARYMMDVSDILSHPDRSISRIG